MIVNGGNEMKVLLFKISVWFVLFFSVMGLWYVLNVVEQYILMKVYVVIMIDKVIIDK